MSYPGGPLIDKLAQSGDKNAFVFTEPKTKNPLDFSFSGLKTGILYFLQREIKNNPDFIKENLEDICASIQQTIINILMKKLQLASKTTGIKEVAIAGGVSANSGIRKSIKDCERTLSWKTYVPKFEYTTDNAAMIGIVGYYRYLNQTFDNEATLSSSRLNINL